MGGRLPRLPDYPPYPDELPTLRFEVCDEVVRQVRSGEAVYRGLAPEDEEAYHAAHQRVLNELRRGILRAVEEKRARLHRNYLTLRNADPNPKAPEHNCIYWRTRDGICSLCEAWG